MTGPKRPETLARLDAFAGEWSIEARFPGLVAEGGTGRGRVTFEWLLGGQYLAQRTDAPAPAPDSLAIIRADPRTGGYSLHYYDSRGVVRIYSMTFDGRTWELVRDAPDFSPLDFCQRFTGTFSDDGAAIDGAWEKSPDGTSWTHDFTLIYRRTA